MIFKINPDRKSFNPVSVKNQEDTNMTRPLHIDFGDPRIMHWDKSNQEVMFYVHYGFEQIVCRISAEAIQRHYDVADTGEEKYLDAARLHFEEISDVLWQKIQNGHIEKDGSVLLKEDKW